MFVSNKDTFTSNRNRRGNPSKMRRAARRNSVRFPSNASASRLSTSVTMGIFARSKCWPPQLLGFNSPAGNACAMYAS